MKQINRLITNICSDQLRETAAFYQSLFDLHRTFESDWYIQLASSESGVEIGIILKDHNLIPENFRQSPQGVYLTFVVENADEIYQIAFNQGFTIVTTPHDTFYGQRRLLLQDPDGTLIDVSSPIKNFNP